MTCNGEMVEVKVKLPRKLYDILAWYMEFTGYWDNNYNNAEDSISAWVADAAMVCLKYEANNGVPDSRRFVENELKSLLEPTF